MASTEIDRFEAFVGHLILEDGTNMRLEAWQKVALTAFFEGTTETLIVIGKKQGKSSLCAAVAIWHALTTKAADCVIVASSREQAALVSEQCAGFVQRTPMLQGRLRPMGVGREVRGIGAFAGSRIKVLPADPRTADGVRPTLAILDELHRHPTSELYSILRDGLVARGGRMLSISTAGEFENPDADDPHSDPLARLRLSARALLLERPFPEWRYVTARSEAFAYHEWALWPGDDPADMALVKACNPSSWTTEENLRQQYESQSMLDWQWQRFRCGLWVGGSEDSVFSSVDWNACADPAIQIPRGARVYVGVDLARIHDTCALVPVWQDTPGHVVTCDSIVLRPPGDGSQIPISEVVPHIIKMREKWDVEIVFDPNAGGGLIAEELSRYDIFANELPQSPANLAAASELLRSLIVERRLTHDGDPTVTSHILSSVQKSVGAEGWRIAKPARGGRHVDAAQALSWAAYVALAPPPADPFMFTI